MVAKRTNESSIAGCNVKTVCHSLFAWLIALASIMPLCSVNACEYPPPPEFAKVAPTAARMFVFRVMGLKVREQSVQSDNGNATYSIWTEADVLVQMTLKGETSNVTSLHFYNGYCGGVNVTIGHHYLIATNQTGEIIELAPDDKTLGDIDPLYDPTLTGIKNLEGNKYVIAATAAMDGKLSFDSVLDADAYRSLATVPPPPPAPVIIKEPCKQPPPKKRGAKSGKSVTKPAGKSTSKSR
jgi:hypothetical protein